jgi:hypothetical protein
VSDTDLFRLHASLAELAGDNVLQPPHARAFAAWIRFGELDQAPVLRTLASEAAAAEGPTRQTAHAAVLGYAASLDRAFVGPFVDALTWLSERHYFVAGRPLTFEVDGLALLGVALGITRLDAEGQTSAKSWLGGLLKQSLASHRPADWNESLIAAALLVLGDDTSGDRVCADLRMALSTKGLVPSSREAQRAAIELILQLTAFADGMTRAAAQIGALKFLLRITSTLNFNSVSVDDVARVLEGVTRSMRRWSWDEAPRTRNSIAARWEIDNEYHVQDMLWAILAPIFPDLDDEEWLKSLGQHQPRADLAIPSLELIIEVKFLRPGGKSVFSNVIQEVATDASTYLQEGSGYGHVIAFVWDDAARTEEHAELRQGLLRIRGVSAAVVLPRPSKMKRPEALKTPTSPAPGERRRGP